VAERKVKLETNSSVRRFRRQSAIPGAREKQNWEKTDPLAISTEGTKRKKHGGQELEISGGREEVREPVRLKRRQVIKIKGIRP